MDLRNLLWRWAPVVLWCGLIFWLSSIPHLTISEGPSDFWLRKSAHMGVYAILFVLVYRALVGSLSRPWNWTTVAVAIVLTSLYAASDEYHQMYVTGRNGSAWDVLIDAVGISMGVAVSGWWRWWQRALSEASDEKDTA